MRYLSLIWVVILLISCRNDKNSMDFDKEKIIEEIKTMLNNYHEDIAKGGLTAEFKYLDSTSDFFWVPPEYNKALSYDSVKKILESSANSFQSIRFHWDTLQIFPLSNEIANYYGIVSGLMIDTAGIETNMSLIESGTIIKRKDGWKLLSGQSAALKLESENKTK